MVLDSKIDSHCVPSVTITSLQVIGRSPCAFVGCRALNSEGRPQNIMPASTSTADNPVITAYPADVSDEFLKNLT